MIENIVLLLFEVVQFLIDLNLIAMKPIDKSKVYYILFTLIQSIVCHNNVPNTY